MNVFEHAMKMEEDGRDYYLDQAKQAKTPVLRRILEELADDESRHYRIFKALRDSQMDDATGFGTAIIATTKNIFDTLKADAASLNAAELGPVSVWEHAREVEKEAEAFYRLKADEENDETKKQALLKIADEEHRHYRALDSVISFLNEPRQWLEDAEWSNLEE